MKRIALNAIACVSMLVTVACSEKTTSTASSSENQQTQTSAQNRQQSRGGERPQFSELLSQMDANGDSKLAKTEVKGRLEKDFDKVDTNNDGFITADEFENAPRPKRRGKKQ